MTPKLARHWQGPYLITRWINDIIYRIQLNQRTKPKVVHRSRLWKYSGKSPPTWLKTTEEHNNKAADTSTAETSQSSTNGSTTREGYSNDESATGSHFQLLMSSVFNSHRSALFFFLERENRVVSITFWWLSFAAAFPSCEDCAHCQCDQICCKHGLAVAVYNSIVTNIYVTL